MGRSSRTAQSVAIVVAALLAVATPSACAAPSAAGTPDNQPVFLRPSSDGIVFRAGHTGRVRGAPPGGANACYASDA